MEDLWELAWGIIAAEDAFSASPQILPLWKKQVRGLCEAFQSIGTVIVRNNWFHSRDFIFLCRLLRIKVTNKGTPFDAIMLLSALRRHFQTSEPDMFPSLAKHFLEKCSLEAPAGDKLTAQVVTSLRESLSDSLIDGSDPTSAHCRYTLVVDPTDCEAAVDLMFSLKLLDQSLTVVVSLSNFPEDASPTMTTAALAQIMKCIEEGKTLLLVNSAPLQSALYDVINRHYSISVKEDGRREAYANIPLGSFSSLIRVHKSFRLIVHIPTSHLCKTPMPFLNRLEKYTLSVRDALAQRVQEVSQNPPLCLRSMSKADHRQRVFWEMEEGVNDFVAFAGGSTSFYGMSPTETVPALILRALEDACQSSNTDFEPRPSVLAAIALNDEFRQGLLESSLARSIESAYISEFTNLQTATGLLSESDKLGEDCRGELLTTNDQLVTEGCDNSAPSLIDLDGFESKVIISVDDITFSGLDSDSHIQETEIKMSDSLDADEDYDSHCESDFRHKSRRIASASASGSYDPASTRLRELIRAVNFQIMETSRVESMFRMRSRLPAIYMREYLENQEHLSVISLLHHVLRLSPRYNITPGLTNEKLVIYTRTDNYLLRMVNDSSFAGRLFTLTRGECGASTIASASASSSSSTSFDQYNNNEYETVIISSFDVAPAASQSSIICILPLTAFTSSADCARTIRNCMCPDGGRRVLIVVADMKQVSVEVYFQKYTHEF